MGFLAPVALAALVLAAVPVALHLLARRPARILPFGPVELVLRAEARVRRRLRVRDAALLAARVLAVVLVVLAVSRPYANVRAAGVAGLTGAESLVLVFDDSMSMRVRGDAPFEAARRAALASIEGLGAGDAAAVVFAGHVPRARPARPTFDLREVRRTIEDARPTRRGTEIEPAIALAARMLHASSRGVRRIVVVTDLQKSGWPGAAAVPDDVSLEVIDVGEASSNVAVVGVEVEPAPEMGGGFVRVTATIAGSSRRAVRGVPVSLSIDGETLARAAVDVPANGTVRHSFHHRIADRGEGVHPGEIAIREDALPDDDRRAFLVAGPRPIRALVVDGDPRPSTREDEAFYLVRALSPGGRADVVPVVVDSAGVAGRRLADFDAVFLCNVASLPGAAVRALETYVAQGGGVLFSGGDRVRPTAWNRTFASLLPVRIRAVRAVPDGTRLEATDERPSGFWVGPGLVGATFTRHLAVEPDPELERETVLRFPSGEPLLVERTIGAGRVLFFASTLDADWTDLPLRTGYLPLVQQAARRLARRGSTGATAARRVGDVVSLPVPAETTRVVVTRPDGQRTTIEPTGGAASYAHADLPGVYRVRTEGRAGGLREDPSLAFVVATDPAESDLRRWSHAPVEGAIVQAAGRARTRRMPLWPTLLALLLPVVLVESGLRAWRPG